MSLVLKGETSLEGRLNALKAILRLKSRADIDNAGRLLIRVIKQARVDRRFELIDSVCDMMGTLLPETAFREVATYYKAEVLHLKSGTPATLACFGKAADEAPPQFRPSALLNLGCAHLRAGQISEFSAASKEALEAARGLDPLSELQALRSIAVVQAVDGDHQGSLSLLESLLPTAIFLGQWYPADVHNHLNSLAIEMGEVGRVAEANHLIDIVLRTGFASRYPGWLDTKVQLGGKQNLVFAPFTLAIGAPLDPAQSEPANGCDQRKPECRVATDASPCPSSEPAPTKCGPNESQPSLAARGLLHQVQAATAASIEFLISLSAWAFENDPRELQLAARMPRTAGLGRYLRPSICRGYPISPPSRAPPSASSAIYKTMFLVVIAPRPPPVWRLVECLPSYWMGAGVLLASYNILVNLCRNTDKPFLVTAEHQSSLVVDSERYRAITAPSGASDRSPSWTGVWLTDA